MKVASHNHNYHKFTDTSANYAIITTGGTEHILYPDKDGVFIFNTYEYASAIFDYTDDYKYETNLIDGNQSKIVTFEIKTFDTNDTEKTQHFLTVTFFNGVKQRWECPFVEEGVVNLSEMKMPYFIGYPFEYSEVTGEVTGYGVNRVLVNDGSGTGNNNNVRNISKQCNGFYLKWHNSNWGYSYYLFEKIGKESFNTKSLGDVREQLSWTDNYFDIGKTGQRKLELFAQIDYQDRELIKSLAKSNEVYLYTGKKFEKATNENWLQVKIESMKVSETNKNNTFEQKVTISLPKEKTRTRI